MTEADEKCCDARGPPVQPAACGYLDVRRPRDERAGDARRAGAGCTFDRHEVQPPWDGHEFMSKVMSNDELAGLVGHRFPGGTYRVAHWENFLLTDCTGREPLPDGLVHPIVLFHAPILGAGTLDHRALPARRGEWGRRGSWAARYDWQYEQPIVEEVDYRVEGRIVGAERHVMLPRVPSRPTTWRSASS